MMKCIELKRVYSIKKSPIESTLHAMEKLKMVTGGKK